MSKVGAISQMSNSARKINSSAQNAVSYVYAKTVKIGKSGLPKELPLPDKHIEDIKVAELLDESLKYLNLKNDIIKREMEFKLHRTERK